MGSKKRGKTTPETSAKPRAEAVEGKAPSTASYAEKKRQAQAAYPRKSNKLKGKQVPKVVEAALRRDDDSPSPFVRPPSRVKSATPADPNAAEHVGLKDAQETKSVEPSPGLPTSEALGSEKADQTVAAEAPSTALTAPPQEPAQLEEADPNKLTPERARAIRKLRTTYGKRLPPVVCDNCPHTQNCPQFRAGYECAFMEVIEGWSLKNLDDIKHAQLRIIEANMTTAEFGLIGQRLSGGIIDKDTSARLDAAFEQLAEFRRQEQHALMARNPEKVTIEGEGIIAKLFGNLGQNKPADNAKPVDVIDVPASEVKELTDAELAKEVHTTKEEELKETLEKFNDL